ncbi:SpoIIE family protein phosphatase [Microtetraspora malaysiensis]|uniref:SpoIIE family protein phosphatase n=1 Tax=Microtetraspora malaysiensis TaxID=161358 RepID=UPI000829E9DE|nr:SpoIIE family protein phosphatase [Microtetraspora malaysiensis]
MAHPARHEGPPREEPRPPGPRHDEPHGAHPHGTGEPGRTAPEPNQANPPNANGTTPPFRLPLNPDERDLLLQRILPSLDAGVYVLDRQARLVYINPRGEQLLRRTAADLVGHDAHDQLHRTADGTLAQRSECRLLRAFLAGGTTHADSEWFARGDGSLLPVRCVSSAYAIDDEPAGNIVVFSPRTSDEEPDRSHHTELVDLTDRLALVAETTVALTSTLDMDESLRRLVRLVVPRLADWAIVDLLDDNDELRRVTVVHHENGAIVNVTDLEGPLPPVAEHSRQPLSQVLLGAPTMLVEPETYDTLPDSGIAAVQRDLFTSTGMHSAVIAPLRGHLHQVLGALTVGRAADARTFGPTELSLVDDIGRRAGLAVDNARLYERERRSVETMQRHLLPPMLEIDDLQMTARYLAAPHASEVGGDWYDLFILPDGVTALVIGDVIGHDLTAAAQMSQLRNILRAYAWEYYGGPPSFVVDRLDWALPHITTATLATLVFARVEGPEGGPWRLHWTSAGHPPPLLVTDDGKVSFLDGGQGLMLGIGMPTGRPNAITPLPPRATLVLYTDGLIESPHEPIDRGMADLARHAASLARRPLGVFCDQLIARARPQDNEDDIALLALRLPARHAPGEPETAARGTGPNPRAS